MTSLEKPSDCEMQAATNTREIVSFFKKMKCQKQHQLVIPRQSEAKRLARERVECSLMRAPRITHVDHLCRQGQIILYSVRQQKELTRPETYPGQKRVTFC